MASPACDMFQISDSICEFYPFLKLKGRFEYQVKGRITELFKPGFTKT